MIQIFLSQLIILFDLNFIHKLKLKKPRDDSLSKSSDLLLYLISIRDIQKLLKPSDNDTLMSLMTSVEICLVMS